MNKILAVIAFALVSVCLITPKFIAPKFQEQVNMLVDQVNKTSGYTAHIESTESSWFGSKNVISFGLDLGMYQPEYQDTNMKIEFVLETQYGPLLFANQGIVGLYKSNIQISGDEQRHLVTWDEAEPIYQLSAVGGFDGGINIEDTIPTFSNMENNLTFSGYNGKGEITNDAFSYEGLLSLVEINAFAQPAKLENITLSMEMEAGLEAILNGGFYNNTTSLSIDSFTVATQLAASNLSALVETILDEETQLGTVKIGYFAKELTYNEYQVNDLTLLSELTKLSNQFLIDYTSFNEDLTKQNLTSKDFVVEQLAFLQNNLEELLSHQPEFNITDFSATFPEGRFEANLTSKLANIKTPTYSQMLTTEFWLYNTLTNINIEADDTLVSYFAEHFLANKMHTTIDSPNVKKGAKAILNNIEQQGFFLHKDDQYRSTITIKNGQSDINGKPFPLL